MKRFVAWLKRLQSKKSATRTQEEDPTTARSRETDDRRSAPAVASVSVAPAAPPKPVTTTTTAAATISAAPTADADRMAQNSATETRAPTARPSFAKSFSAPSGGDAVASFRESLSATRRRAAPLLPPPPLLHIRSDPSASRPATDGGGGGGGSGNGGDDVVCLSYSRPNSCDTPRAAAACASTSTFESLASLSRPRNIPERPDAIRHPRIVNVYSAEAPTAHDDDDDDVKHDDVVAVGSPGYSSLPTLESLMPPEMPRSLAGHLSSSYSAAHSLYAHSPARTSGRHRPRADNSGRDEAIAHSIESEEEEQEEEEEEGDDESSDAESGGRGNESDASGADANGFWTGREDRRSDAVGGGGGGGGRQSARDRVAENPQHRSEAIASAGGSDRRRSREWHAEFRRRHATPPTARPETRRSVRPAPASTVVRRPIEGVDDLLPVRHTVTEALERDRVWAVERKSWKPHESVWVDLCVKHRRCARRLTGTVCEYACSIRECGPHYYTFDYHSRRSAHLTWEMAARLRHEELAELANAKPRGLSLLRSWHSTPEGLCR